MERYISDDIENQIPHIHEKFDNTFRKHVRFDTPSKKDFQHHNDPQVPKPPLRNIQNIYSVNNEQPHSLLTNRTTDIMSKFNKTNLLQRNKDLELSVCESPNSEPRISHPRKFLQNIENKVPHDEICYSATSSIGPNENLFRKSTVSNFPYNPNELNSDVPINRSKGNVPNGINSPNTLGFFTMPNSRSNILETLNSPKYKVYNQFQESEKNMCTIDERYFPEVARAPSSKKQIEKHSIGSDKCCNCGLNTKPKHPTNINQTSIKYSPQIDLTNERQNKLKEIQNGLQLRESELRNIDYVKSDSIEANGQLPTVFDLYTLIKMQIEQLHYLQDRVNELSNKVESKHAFESNPINSVKFSQNEEFNMHQKVNALQEHRESGDVEMQKISVGVMTSFEVTVSSNKLKVNKCNNIDEGVQTSMNIFQERNLNSQYNEDRIQRTNGVQTFNFLDGIDQYDSNADNYLKSNNTNMKNNEAMIFENRNEDLRRNTPVPRITYNECNQISDSIYSQPQVGWTFYNNTMKHINDLLTPPDKFQDDTRNEYRKKMTITETNHISFENLDINASSSKRVTFNINEELPIRNNEFRNKHASEISLHMDKLAAKYFDDHVLSSNRVKKSTCNNLMKRSTNPIADIENDMTTSQIQHMKKFNLLPGLDNREKMNFYPKTYGTEVNKEFRPIFNYTEPAHTKILDITALKQQPKLL